LAQFFLGVLLARLRLANLGTVIGRPLLALQRLDNLGTSANTIFLTPDFFAPAAAILFTTASFFSFVVEISALYKYFWYSTDSI
jgi:hypothetical protein